METDLPNIIFASWKPQQLFFPANRIKVDDYGSLRSPFELTDGTVYSVISEQPVYSAGTAAAIIPGATTPLAGCRIYSLPDNDEHARRSQAAAGNHRAASRPAMTRSRPSRAICKENYTYDLDVPPQDAGKGRCGLFPLR